MTPVERDDSETGQSVGWLDLEVRSDPDSPIMGLAALEVRTIKLSYEREYRQMLKDIGALAAEATVQGFAPTAQRFELDPGSEAALLYQRFAALASRLFDEELDGALVYVLSQPHREWRDEFEERAPGLPVGGSSTLVKALTAPGPRVQRRAFARVRHCDRCHAGFHTGERRTRGTRCPIVSCASRSSDGRALRSTCIRLWPERRRWRLGRQNAVGILPRK